MVELSEETRTFLHQVLLHLCRNFEQRLMSHYLANLGIVSPELSVTFGYFQNCKFLSKKFDDTQTIQENAATALKAISRSYFHECFRKRKSDKFDVQKRFGYTSYRHPLICSIFLCKALQRRSKYKYYSAVIV